MRWAGLVACNGAKRNVYRSMVAKVEGKGPVGTPNPLTGE